MYDNTVHIAEFKEFLDNVDYSQLLCLVLGDSVIYTDPLPPYTYVKRNVMRCQNEIHDILCFLCLNEYIAKNILQEYISQGCIEFLIQSDLLLDHEDKYRLNNLVVSTYANCYFFVSTPYYYGSCIDKIPSPYIGKDTFWLTRAIINKTKGNVLELCTGSGIQAIIAAKTAEHVIAVDIDIHALKIAKINAYLNDVGSKIEFIHGDLFDALTKNENQIEQFDFILSNPPFIPVPKEINYPLSGDGGVDGMDIIRKIYKGYEKYLSPNGKAYMIGQAIGTDEDVFLFDEMTSILCHSNIKFYTFDKAPLSLQAKNSSRLTNELEMNSKIIDPATWLKSNSDSGGDMFYSFLSIVSKTSSKPQHSLIKIENTWRELDVPQISPYSITKLHTMYLLQDAIGNKVDINDEVVLLLKQIDGNLNIRELVDRLPLAIRLKYGDDSEDYLIAKYSKVLYELNLLGIVSKKIQ